MLMVFFDDRCGFCRAFVEQLPKGSIDLYSIWSSKGRNLSFGLGLRPGESIVVVDELGRVLCDRDAFKALFLRTQQRFKAMIVSIVPKFLFIYIYGLIRKRRPNLRWRCSVDLKLYLHEEDEAADNAIVVQTLFGAARIYPISQELGSSRHEVLGLPALIGESLLKAFRQRIE